MFFVFIKLYAFVIPYEKKEGVICIRHHDNTESLNLSYIPNKECTGYQFRCYENILYTNKYETSVKGKLNVLFRTNYPGWLSNNKINLKEHQGAYALPIHYAGRKLEHLPGKLWV